MAGSFEERGMTQIVYRLNKGIRLIHTLDGFFCLSYFPLRAIRINEALFKILKALEKEEETGSRRPSPQEKGLFERLAQKGILWREEIPEQMELPSVSVIIPVKNRPQELYDCLRSLENLDYPRAKLEIIVVDDASTDASQDVVEAFSVRIFRMKRSMGQSACRNFAARKAKGKVLAFLDSDCVASTRWLMNLVPYFGRQGIVAIGGYVDGYFDRTSLDRYEKVCSPLFLGLHDIEAGPGPSPFYLPSCNFLVYRKVFLDLDGFCEDLQVGEDVDLSWRLRKEGHTLRYIPKGIVYHKHRSALFAMLKRRFDYGSSEAPLLLRHPEKIKAISNPYRDQFLFITICSFLLFPSKWTLIPWAGMMSWDLIRKLHVKKRKKIRSVSLYQILCSTLRWGFFSLAGLSYLIVRYYLILLLIAGWLYPNLLLLSAALFSIAAFTKKFSKPELSFFPFTLYFFLEQLAYQAGVIKGCLRFNIGRPFLFRFRQYQNQGDTERITEALCGDGLE
jgi:mycofactocin system glycosyltransferase